MRLNRGWLPRRSVSLAVSAIAVAANVIVLVWNWPSWTTPISVLAIAAVVFAQIRIAQTRRLIDKHRQLFDGVRDD